MARSQNFSSEMKATGAQAPTFVNADVLETEQEFNFGEFDLILSNPPYVMESERSQIRKNVLDYEPASALFVPDEDPLKFYRAIARWSDRFLAAEGKGLTEINEGYELLRRIQGQGGEVRGVGTHVGDQTPFIERLCDAHGGSYGEVELPGCLLLEGGGGERRGREPGSLLLFQGLDPVGGAHGILEELPGVRHRLEAGVQQGLDLHTGRGAFRMEDGWP